MSPSLQAQLEQWLKGMRPTPANEPKGEQAVRHKHEDAAFLERLRDKITSDARAERR
jgi:hypothetical protein